MDKFPPFFVAIMLAFELQHFDIYEGIKRTCGTRDSFPRCFNENFNLVRDLFALFEYINEIYAY